MAPSVGIDYRPALLQSAGIGRAVRELAHALPTVSPATLHLFGHSFARAKRSDALPPAQLHRWPIPGRSLPLLARLGLDAARLCGQVAVFHWTDYVHPPVHRVPTVLTIHDLAMTAAPEFHGPASEWMWERCRAAAAQSAAILCPTHATAAAVRAEMGIDEETIHVIPFGADHALASDEPPPLKAQYILALGTIEPRKNHDRLIAAWRDLAAPRPALVVLGRRGWQCETTEALLRSEPDILWLENADDATVRRYLTHAALLAYPSRLEGFGFPPLEALQIGTPVVAGDTPALREVLGDAAHFADPLDVDALRTALHEVLTNQDWRRELIDRGRRQSAGFRWQECAAAHARVYATVAANGSSCA